MNFDRNLEICMPYLGPVVGKYSDWTPLAGRGDLKIACPCSGRKLNAAALSVAPFAADAAMTPA